MGGENHPNHYRDERYVDAVERLQEDIDNPHLGVQIDDVADELGASRKTARCRLKQLWEDGKLRRCQAAKNIHGVGYRNDDAPEFAPPKGPNVTTD